MSILKPPERLLNSKHKRRFEKAFLAVSMPHWFANLVKNYSPKELLMLQSGRARRLLTFS